MTALSRYWAHKGHAFGKCHSSPGSKWFWINIPKNASSFTQTLLAHELLWFEHDFHQMDLTNKVAWVVLRDPVDRWLSGMAEYITRYHRDFDFDQLNQQSLDLIFDRVAFDDHTESQVYFFDGVDRNKIKWFWCGPGYEQTLIRWLQSIDLLPEQYTVPEQVRQFTYATCDDAVKQEIKSKFSLILEQSPKYLTSVKSYFDQDYRVIDAVRSIM